MKRFFVFIAIILCSSIGLAQQFMPPQNKNAALRYWMAFADLTDHSADRATVKSMEDVLTGAAQWDEQKLGEVLEENSAAVIAMQRATALPECNWGLDYERGSAMSLGHLPKARVLARLNALYGVRQMAKGDAAGAVATWLAGLRFAQCISRDVGLIGLLSAKPAFMANLHLLAMAAQGGNLTVELQEKIRAAVRQLPVEGLDWQGSIKSEAWADEEGLKYLAKAPNFQETYKAFFGSAAPAQPPSQSDIAAFRSLIREVLAAFQMSPAQAKQPLTEIAGKIKNMNTSVQAIFPNYSRMNDVRIEVVNEQEKLLQALAGQRSK
ncbi:MAG TPA: hypothetical protein VH724_06520 [Candidatus Angelobacter sp.]|nr:hypothetical protein [Candidatus Angelobacter sp.]